MPKEAGARATRKKSSKRNQSEDSEDFLSFFLIQTFYQIFEFSCCFENSGIAERPKTSIWKG